MIDVKVWRPVLLALSTRAHEKVINYPESLISFTTLMTTIYVKVWFAKPHIKIAGTNGKSGFSPGWWRSKIQKIHLELNFGDEGVL